MSLDPKVPSGDIKIMRGDGLAKTTDGFPIFVPARSSNGGAL